MTAYDTTALAIAIIGDEKVETNRKSATRTLRKFLRTDFAAREVATPGKGGRYSIDLTKPQLKAMAKRFAAWEIAQAEEQAARRAALEAKVTKVEEAPAPVAEVKDDDEATDEAEVASDEADPEEVDLDAMILELEAEASDEAADEDDA